MGAKSATPPSNGFLAHRKAAFGEQVFHIAKTERESMLEKNGV